jgi:major membrane immunogen (membrane-anchored lipoprotein)
MKKIIAAIVLVCMLITLVACGNMDMMDTVYTFDYAIIRMPNGTTETVEVKRWLDFDTGDQIQITAKDGTVYLVHSSNCILVREGKG